jgi:hypothetical protein
MVFERGTSHSKIILKVNMLPFTPSDSHKIFFFFKKNKIIKKGQVKEINCDYFYLDVTIVVLIYWDLHKMGLDDTNC